MPQADANMFVILPPAAQAPANMQSLVRFLHLSLAVDPHALSITKNCLNHELPAPCYSTNNQQLRCTHPCSLTCH
jgi:hypothetical protein